MPKSWDDVWLNNAFAQYFAGLFTATENEKAEYLIWYYPFERWNIDNDWYNGNKHPIVTNNYKDVAVFITDSYSKFRGAHVLKMLQNELGEELWWKAVQNYVQSNVGKQVTTNDFQLAIEKVSGKDYQWFFDQWIYKVGMPELEVNRSYDKETKQLHINVKQVQQPDSTIKHEQVEYFQGKIDIEIEGTLYEINLLPKAENDYTFSFASEPSYVYFNHEETFLCNAKMDKSSKEYLAQLSKSNGVLARKQAMDQLTLIYQDTASSNILKSQIKKAFINEINSKEYWRYRMYALGCLRKIATLPYDQEMIELLLKLIKDEKSWIKQSAIFALANTSDKKYLSIYKDALNDKSDRVINAAAFAIGKTKAAEAKEILLSLEDKKSWKNQNRISALIGLEQLGDTSVVPYVLDCIEDNTSPRWYLATPTWDYPYTAVNTLVSLGQGRKAYPILFDRFKNSLKENDLNDIFQNLQLIDFLKDNRALEFYKLLEEKFKDDVAVLNSVKGYKETFLQSLK